MSMYDYGWACRDYWDSERQEYTSSRKAGKPLGPDAPHYPNKAERKLLTQMMQKSGQTEDEVRASKSNRQKLAAASKSMMQTKGYNRRYEYEIKIRRRNEAARLGVEVWQLDNATVR